MIINKELAGYEQNGDLLRNIVTCISPTNCFDLHFHFNDSGFEVLINNTRIYYGSHSSISFGYSSQMGNITLNRCSSVPELCGIDKTLSDNESSTSRSTLDHVIGVSGRKDVVREFNSSESVVHRVACYVVAWSANKLTTQLTFDGRLFQRYVLLLLDYDNGYWPGGVPSDTYVCEWLRVLYKYAFIILLDPSKQYLSGTLPEDLGWLKSLEILSLHDNTSNGTFPLPLHTPEKLLDLNLGNNAFTGRPPSSLPPNIKVLNVGDNLLSGPTPPEVGQWESLGNIKKQVPKEMEYHHDILLPAHAADAVSTGVFDLLHMALPLPFNHGLPVGYAISGKTTGAQAIKMWNVFTGKGDTSNQWLDTHFFYQSVRVISADGKQATLCWGQSQTLDREPPISQGPWPIAAVTLSCFLKLQLEALVRGSNNDQASA
jgi:hypothetical protein